MSWLRWVLVAIQYAPQVVTLVKDLIDHLHGAKDGVDAVDRFRAVRKVCDGEFCASRTKGLE